MAHKDEMQTRKVCAGHVRAAQIYEASSVKQMVLDGGREYINGSDGLSADVIHKYTLARYTTRRSKSQPKLHTPSKTMYR